MPELKVTEQQLAVASSWDVCDKPTPMLALFRSAKRLCVPPRAPAAPAGLLRRRPCIAPSCAGSQMVLLTLQL